MGKVGLLTCGAMLALVPYGTVACASSDPLSITCQEYVKKSNSEQLDLAARWGSPDRKTVNAGAELVAPKYRQDLLNYCPGHPKDRLKDLEFRFGPG